jgi:type I site-specific restriction endonuclease
MTQWFNEKQTRKQLIDRALESAGWEVENNRQVGIEIPVDGLDPAAWQQLERQFHRIREQAEIKDVTLPAGRSKSSARS